jgi:hypothetical protein
LKGVFEGRWIMNIKGHNDVCTDCFKQTSDIAGCDWIVWFGAAIFSRITKVRRNCRNAGGTRIFEGADEKQKAAKFIIWRLEGIPIKTLHDVDVFSSNRIGGPGFMLAILEMTLLMLC